MRDPASSGSNQTATSAAADRRIWKSSGRNIQADARSGGLRHGILLLLLRKIHPHRPRRCARGWHFPASEEPARTARRTARSLMLRHRDAPMHVAILSFNRPHYLRPVLNSLRVQVCERDEIVLVQDGAANPWSGEVKASHESIQECVDIFRSTIPWGAVLQSRTMRCREMQAGAGTVVSIGVAIDCSQRPIAIRFDRKPT